jgi:DNA-binding CsgD family transcriptional regulator
VVAVQGIAEFRPEVRRLVEMAAVFGEPFSVVEMAEAVDWPVGQVLVPLEEAVSQGVLQACDARLTFVDPALRASVYDTTLGPVRTALHRRIGMIRLRVPGGADSAAKHLLAAARGGDRTVAADLDRVGHALIRTDPVAAARLRLAGWWLTDSHEDLRPVRAAAAAEALLCAGRVDQSARLAELGLRCGGTDSSSAARLRVACSAALLVADRADQAVAQVEAALREQPLTIEVAEAACALRLQGLLELDEPLQVQAAAEATLGGADGMGTDNGLAMAVLALAHLAWGDGRASRATGLARAAVRRADTAQTGHGVGRVSRVAYARMLTCLGEAETAGGVVDELEAHLRRRPELAHGAVPVLLRARLALGRGEFAVAADQAEQALASAEQLGAASYLSWAAATLATARLRCGDVAAASALVRRHDLARRRGPDAASGALVAAQVVAAAADPSEALDLIGAAGIGVPPPSRVLIEECDAPAWWTRLALAAGDRALAADVVASVERLAANSPTSVGLRAGAHHARALLQDDAGLLVRVGVEHPQPWARVRAVEDAGCALARRHDSEATAALRSALAGYERFGARTDADRVRSRLRALGVRTRHWTRRSRPDSGWAGLTETEFRVAHIVAEGATNAEAASRLFLSRHTVDFHLRQIFRKLQIRSRVELARLVAAAGEAPNGCGGRGNAPASRV